MSSQNTIYDAAALLESGDAAVTASARCDQTEIDLGSASAQLPATACVEVDVTAVDFTTADETYELKVQLTDVSGFGGTVIDVNQRDITAVGKYIIPVTNEVNGTRYEFVSLYATLGGTTPSITYTASLSVR